MARVKGGTVSKTRRRKVLKEANIVYIKQLKNKFFIVEFMRIAIEDKRKEISENYGLLVLMQLVEKMIFPIQNL